MKFMIPFLIAMLPVASAAQSQSAVAPGVPSVPIPKTTEVLVIQTPKQGVTAQQIMAVIPAEIRATVKLYLDGKIRQWYSRGDGKGVIFVVDAKTEDEARAVMDTLPLAKEQLMDHEYIPVGPLMPLMALMGAGTQRSSPPATAKCDLPGGKSVAMDYSRPQMKGRQIFGGLVPYGQVWRVGANEATTFVTTADLMIGGKHVPAGSYTLFAIPAKDKWTLIISKKTGEWGIPYPEGFDLVRLDMKAGATSAPVESLRLPSTKTAAAARFGWSGRTHAPGSISLRCSLLAILQERHGHLNGSKETFIVPQLWFFVSIAFSFIAWGIVTARYIWPELRLRQRAEALRPLLILHSFRFIGLAFLVPGVVSADLPSVFARSAAYGDIIAAILAFGNPFFRSAKENCADPALVIVSELGLACDEVAGNGTSVQLSALESGTLWLDKNKYVIQNECFTLVLFIIIQCSCYTNISLY